MSYLKKGPRFDLNFHENQLTRGYSWWIYAWFCLLIFFYQYMLPPLKNPQSFIERCPFNSPDKVYICSSFLPDLKPHVPQDSLQWYIILIGFEVQCPSLAHLEQVSNVSTQPYLNHNGLTEVAREDGPDLAPQKFLLSQKFRHLMWSKKYL